MGKVVQIIIHLKMICKNLYRKNILYAFVEQDVLAKDKDKVDTRLHRLCWFRSW